MGYWVPSVESNELRGQPLRYLLVVILADAGRPLPLAALIDGCREAGVVFDGRPSKVVSDALRWEVEHHRVARVGRGVYTFRGAPDTTMRWIRRRTEQTLHWLAAEPGGSDGAIPPSSPPPRSWVPPWPGWPTRHP